MDKNFIHARFNQLQCEYLAWCGEPMLYDGDLFVLREPIKTQFEYYRWVKGIRVC